MGYNQGCKCSDCVEAQRNLDGLTEGWHWPFDAYKAHYFGRDNISLCGRHSMVSGEKSEEAYDDSLTCRACLKALGAEVSETKAAASTKQKIFEAIKTSSRGMTTDGIATKIGKSESTVRRYLRALLDEEKINKSTLWGGQFSYTWVYTVKEKK